MFKVGDVCLKIAGRDAGKIGVVIKIEENGYLLLEGEVRRRAVNPLHVEPLGKRVDVKENASYEEVSQALKKLGIEIKPKGQPRKPGPKPVKKRKSAEKAKEKETKGKEKEEKKEGDKSKKEQKKSKEEKKTEKKEKK